MSEAKATRRPETWLAAVWSLLVRVTLAAALLYALYRVGFIIVVVLISVMLALTMAPLVDWLERTRLARRLPRGVRRTVATTLVFLGLGVTLAGLGVMIVQPLLGEIRDFLANWRLHQSEWMRRADWLQQRYADLPDPIRLWLAENSVRDFGTQLGEQLRHLGHRTVESGMLVVELILIPVLAFSFLTESKPLKRELMWLVPRARVRDMLYLTRQSGIILQSYAVGQLILALIAGGVVWVLMVGLGIRYALALALIAAITRVIPVIGPIIGGIPIVLFASLQGWESGLFVLVAFTVMHLVESKVVMPRIIGYRIHLHPAVVIVVLLIGAEFFGMWGMFLAAPVVAVAKVVFHYFLVRPAQRGRPAFPERVSPSAPRAASPSRREEREPDLERPAIAGAGSRTRAH